MSEGVGLCSPAVLKSETNHVCVYATHLTLKSEKLNILFNFDRGGRQSVCTERQKQLVADHAK